MKPTPSPLRPSNLRARPDWLPASEFPFESHYVEIDGDDIHYIDEGAGPALLLVNVGMWSFVFRDVAVRLRRDFRVIALDFPGLGLSTASGPAERSVEQQSMTLERFIEALDLQDLTMLVHDVGGPVGLGYAARHPGRIRGLIVANTFGFPLRDYRAIRGMLGLVGSRAFDAINARTNLFARFSASGGGVGRHLSVEGKRAFLGPWDARAVRRASIAALRSIGHIDGWMEGVEGALKTTLNDRPVLTVYGSRNDPFGWQDRFRAMLPASRHLRVDGGNHFPFADEPDLVADTILAWWQEAVAPPAEAPTERAQPVKAAA